jgi:hypothetical protein
MRPFKGNDSIKKANHIGNLNKEDNRNEDGNQGDKKLILNESVS